MRAAGWAWSRAAEAWRRCPSFWLALLAALAAGAALRAAFIIKLPYISDDSLMYGNFAKNLIERGVYGFSANGAPSLIRLPGYPLFLAACFRLFGVGRYGAVLGLQAAFDLASCGLMAGLAARLFGRRAGWAALWLAVLCPFSANYVAAVISETLTLFCLTLALFALERWLAADRSGFNPWLYVLAFGLGYGILLRPEQGLVAVAIVAAMLWVRMRRREGRSLWTALAPVAAVCLLTVLPLFPWTVRNWRVLHVFQPLAPRFATDPGEFNPAGFQRWYRTWAIDYASTEQVYWPLNGDNISIADLPDRAFDSDAQYSTTEELLNLYNRTDDDPPTLDERFNALAAERIKADPLRYYLELPVARTFNMMFHPRDYMLPWPLDWWKFRLHPLDTTEASLYALLNLAYFVLAGITLWRRRLWRAHQPLVWAMVATIVLRALLLLTLDNSEMRYTLEFFPVLIVLAAANFARRATSVEPAPY